MKKNIDRILIMFGFLAMLIMIFFMCARGGKTEPFIRTYDLIQDAIIEPMKNFNDSLFFTVSNSNQLFADTTIIDDTMIITDTGCFIISGDSYGVDISKYEYSYKIKSDTGIFAGLFVESSAFVYPDYANNRIILKSDINNYAVGSIRFRFFRGEN